MTTEAPGATTGVLTAVALKTGDVLGERYEIIRVLGQGGMGTVYEARHKILGRPVAIKVLKPEVAYNEQFSARFLQEAKSAAELHHRNIVELTDYGFFGDQPYMVMEFLRGESLDSLLEREGPLSPGRAVTLIEPVLRALAMAHERGIIHRDIKPDNIFLVDDSDGGEPTPKVVDFGIAKRQTTEENVQLTTATMALGTPAYMSPEQIMASKNATGAADQYAVGVTLYECLTGRYPFDADTINAFIIAKATQEAIPLQSLRPDLDPALCAVVMRTLARKPEDRFPNISALREALLPWKGVDGPASVAPGSATLGGVKAPGPVALPSAPTAMQGTPHLASQTPEPAEVVARPAEAPSSMGKWIGVGVAALAVLGLGGFAATRLGRGESPDPHVVATPPLRPVEAHDVPAAPQPPSTVVFTIRVTPADAQITLDDEVVGNGRAELVKTRDGRAHQLRVTAPGYTTHTSVLTASENHEIDLQLAPAAVAQTPEPAREGRDRRHGSRNTAQPAQPSQPAQPAQPSQPAQPAHPTTPPEHPTTPTAPARDPRHPSIDPTNPFG